MVLLENNRVYVFGQICDTSLRPTEIQMLAYYPIVQVAAGWNYFAGIFITMRAHGVGAM